MPWEFDLWAAAFFTFLGIAFTGLLDYCTKSKRQKLDSNQQLFQNAFTQMGMLQNRIEVLESEREELLDDLKSLMDELNTIKLENAELRAENKILRERIEDLLSNKR